jgi:hypothetical protein
MPSFEVKGISPGDNYLSAKCEEFLSYYSPTLILTVPISFLDTLIN